MKPIVGIVTRPDLESEKFPVSCIYEDYRISIIKSGGVPIGICHSDLDYLHDKAPSNTQELTEEQEDIIKSQIDLCDAIVFQGGDTWHHYDVFCLKYALEKDIPILGICLGMQMMANYVSNEYPIDDKTVKINSDIKHKQSGVKYAHDVILKGNSKLAGIFNKTKIQVNSSHNYKILDNDSITTGYGSDGTAEAIEIPGKDFAIGVQWHPEKMYDYDENSRLLFKHFIDAAEDYSNKKEIK